jgi:hypothetical protein
VVESLSTPGKHHDEYLDEIIDKLDLDFLGGFANDH